MISRNFTDLGNVRFQETLYFLVESPIRWVITIHETRNGMTAIPDSQQWRYFTTLRYQFQRMPRARRSQALLVLYPTSGSWLSVTLASGSIVSNGNQGKFSVTATDSRHPRQIVPSTEDWIYPTFQNRDVRSTSTAGQATQFLIHAHKTKFQTISTSGSYRTFTRNTVFNHHPGHLQPVFLPS